MHCPPASNTHSPANKSPELTREDFYQRCGMTTRNLCLCKGALVGPLYERSCQGSSFGWQVGPKPQERDDVPSHCQTAKLLFRRQFTCSRLRQQFLVLVSALDTWRGPFRRHTLPGHKLLHTSASSILSLIVMNKGPKKLFYNIFHEKEMS